MIHTFTDNNGNEVIPFGSAQVTVKDGFWTFNGKQVRKGDIALQMFVSRFIIGCRLAFPIKEKRQVTPSHSVIATREQRYAHGHLSHHNYKFPDWVLKSKGEADIVSIPTPTMDIFPEFIKKDNAEMQLGTFTTLTGTKNQD